ncbi:MAG: Flp pilus assembly complex ATPase component TadA [Phycisphaerales bacterium]|nr:MAG: Flp pilus assembly complex ATPase component TadA [Phycisphaerales bacterium]
MVFGKRATTTIKLPPKAQQQPVRPESPRPQSPIKPSSKKPGSGEPRGRVADERLEAFNQLKSKIHRKLVEQLDMARMADDDDSVRRQVRDVVEHLCEQEHTLLNLSERQRLISEVLDETFGLGPLEVLLADPSISDVLINGPKQIYVERKGRLTLTDVRFRDEAHLMHVIDKIVSAVGRRCDEVSPMVDARLADGSRVNAVIPPLAIDGATMSIRRFGADPLTWDDYITLGSCTEQMRDFLNACVLSRFNVLIVGGTGSGKTTLLNNLSTFIPESERIVTIEDAAELQLRQPHVVRLESRPANIEGRGRVSIRELLINSLRMRPDRIVVGECRGPETLDMLQAMNTGHDGSLTTIHANSTRDAVARVETMVMMAGFELPLRAIRQQFASAINIIVQAQRLTGGPRKMVSITEVQGMEGDIITMQDIFAYEQLGIGVSGKAYGRFVATGIRPSCLERMKASGAEVDTGWFERQVLFEDEPE